MLPSIDVWRMSASRPWQLEKTHPDLVSKLKYDGELRFHLIESVRVESLSTQCINFAKYSGYKIHVIKPAKGQGYAAHYALSNVVDSEFSLKWEDDFKPAQEINLTECISLMMKFQHINQIAFNKRPNLEYKWISDENGKFKFFKKERRFRLLKDKYVTLQVKDRWWFGPSIWRTSFIKPIFQYWESNTHNKLNDDIIMPLAGFVYGDEPNGFKGRKQPTAEQIENHIGCYVYGGIKHPTMAEHTGRNDSLWSGEMQKRWAEEGLEVIGV